MVAEIIGSGLRELGYDAVPPETVECLCQYGKRLLEKNQVMNLTAITEPEAVARLHMLDCAALRTVGDWNGKSLIDVGTGAGFPGLVLKILYPSLRLTLLDSLQKRLDWLTELCGELGLSDVTILHARAEEAAHDPALRDGFDYATARAVAALPMLCELCLPYVRPGGAFLAMKSGSCAEEIAAAQGAIQKLKASPCKAVRYTIPGTEVERQILIIGKQERTPERYPRPFAKIKKQPL